MCPGLVLVAFGLLASCERSGNSGVPAERHEPAAAGVSKAVAPPLAATSVPVGGGPLGDAAPALLHAVAPDGSWAVLCQATGADKKLEVGHHGALEGEGVTGRLVLSGGPGTPIEELVDFSRDGRWLAVIRGRALELVDARSGESWTLSDADVRDDRLRQARHRAAMFAEDDRLFYLRRDGDAVQLAVLDLKSRAAKAIPVAGLLVRVWRASRRWVPVAVVVKDTDGDKTLEIPEQESTLAPRMCRGEPLASSDHGLRGDLPELRWLDLETGELRAPDRVVTAVGDSPVERTSTGGMRWGRQPDLGSDCTVVVTSEVPPRVVAACGPAAGPRTLWLLGEKLRVELGRLSEAAAPSTDLPPVTEDELICFDDHGWTCARLLDGVKARLPRNPAAELGSRAVLVAGGAATVFDVSTGKQQVIRPVPDGPVRARGKDHLVIGDVAIDVRVGRVMGKVAGDPVAIGDDGRVLVRKGDTGRGVFDGPLTWVVPTP